ncbi:MAG TPA: serine hydrolase domain-containing protein [Terracidiphilus sp.]|nr:serine hydrolase domain-containing protein [Terracidiphilus sp.]
MRVVRRVSCSISLLFCLSVCAGQVPAPQLPTVAAPPSAPPVPAPAPANPVTTPVLAPEDLEAFFDGILPLQLERSDIAGASVLVIKDGNVLLQKGYGYADVKSKKPVEPAATIFRLASISKLFTWVSVMQLVEQGKLDLDTDINHYLDFQIRPAFNKPVTLRNLMTHTGGFEEVLNDIIVTDPKKAVSLRDHLVHNQPMRLFPPGEVPAYSNYGVGLASYIVQRVSGVPFEQYVHDNLFVPLGMTHSSFYQPLEKDLTYTDSLGYRGSTLKPPVGFEFFNPVGAGGISSSAADMGRFGLALLNGGELDGKRILKPETLALMWTPQFRASDQLPPICMGFYQTWRNNLRWIGHEGDLIAFHSLFFVEPAQKLVLFVAYNSAGGGNQPRSEIINAFSDRYFPGPPKVAFLNTPARELKDVEGEYEGTRRADSTKLRLFSVFNQSTAKVDKEGVLTIEGRKDLRGHPVKWKPIGKDLWQAQDDQDRIFGIRDAHNRIVRLAEDFPGIQLQRVPWYEKSTILLPALAVSVLICALVLVATLIRIGRRLFMRRRPRLVPQPGTIWLTFGPRTASIVWALLASALSLFFAIKENDLMPPTPDWFRWFVIINWVTGVALLFSILAVAAGIRIWWHAHTRWITKVKFTMVALACLLLSWFAVHWNLIGPARRI